MKNKTLAAWLAFLGGPIGLHRFYLYGLRDPLAWLLILPTSLGVYGVQRIATFGQDDALSWLLVPLLGLTIAGCALVAILYGLSKPEKWNRRHNPGAALDAPAGRTHWFTVFAVASALLIGTTVLMASLAFSFQHYFEYQAEEGRKISQ